ncbi:MAG: DNA replication/repair protein RecF [Candidatus Doudnabacteria bacterium]|nr:DNA replication/repair protein RecF [Candidatus Doudnabacteria bacterium]
MRVKQISIKNFRNYPELELDITSDLVVLSGPNAVGKTNLLESVYFASLFKSFRDDSEFIFMRDTSTAEVRVTIEKKGQMHVIEVFLEQRDKIYANFKLDGVVKRRREMQGFLNVVIFEPSDVALFTGAPEARRRYLNMVLSQKDPQYLEDITNYKKVLSQKNRVLQQVRAGQAQKEELTAWNEQVVRLGVPIVMHRKRFIGFLNQHIAEIYSSVSGFHRPVEVEYETLAGTTMEEVEESLRRGLAEQVSREIATASSVVGPHRDDFNLKSDGLFLAPFSSRGELRSQILALKVLELEYVSKGEDKAILLLDDVLSELDDQRRTFLLKYLQGKFQTFITTTHPLEMPAQHVTLTPSAEEVQR